MGFAQSPSNANHKFSQAGPLKHHFQAYLLSIPVLFLVILFMLLYTFYLLKQAITFSHPSPPPPPPITRTLSIISLCQVGLKEDLKDELPTVVFDEELKARDSLCCVCLGEFEMKEELIQVPPCNHIFHSDCIRNWLSSTTTCPLCRCSVIVLHDTRLVLPPSPPETLPAVLLPATSIQLTVTN